MLQTSPLVGLCDRDNLFPPCLYLSETVGMATVRGMLKSSIWGPSWSAGLEQMAFLASTGIGLGKQETKEIDLTSYIDQGGLLKVSVWSVQARQGTGSPAVSLLYEKGRVTEDPGERSNLWVDGSAFTGQVTPPLYTSASSSIKWGWGTFLIELCEHWMT